jgi:hypothetical protein
LLPPMIAVLSTLCYYKLNSRGGTGFGGKVINPCFGAVLSAIFTKYVHLIACMFLPFAAMQAVCLYMFLGESCESRSARIAKKLYKLPSLICINYAFFIFSYRLNSRIWMYPQRIGSSQMADKSVVEDPPPLRFPARRLSGQPEVLLRSCRGKAVSYNHSVPAVLHSSSLPQPPLPQLTRPSDGR